MTSVELMIRIMEYPGTRFRRPWRLLLLALIILAFFVIAPLVIISTIGFTYNWQKGALEATGAISIDAMPSSATVFLNDKKLLDTLPLRLAHVPPGNFTIRLAADGFYDWQKAFTVKSNETVYFKDIQLIKKNDPQSIAAGAFEALVLSPSGAYLAFTSSSAIGKEVWLLNTETNKHVIVTTKVTAETNVGLSWNPKNDYLVVAIGPEPYTKITITPAAAPERSVNMSALVARPVKKFEWAATAEPALYISAGNKLLLVSAITKEAQAIVQDAYLDWSFENNELWTLTHTLPEDSLAVTKDTLGFASVVGRLSLSDLNSSSSSPWRLNEAKNNTALLQNNYEQKRLLITKQGAFSLPQGSARVSPFGNWWFMWSPFELWGSVENGQPFLLSRSGESLRDVVILDEFNTVALVWERRVSVLYPVYGTSHTVLERSLSSLATDPQKRIMYFSDKEGLWRLEY